MRRQPVVKEGFIESRAIRVVTDPCSEQRVPMSQHPLEVPPCGVVARRKTTQDIVEEITALRRTTFHQLEIIG